MIIWLLIVCYMAQREKLLKNFFRICKHVIGRKTSLTWLV